MKNNLLKTILISWSIVSFVYIIYITWNDFKVKEVKVAYQAGITKTLNQIIKQTQSVGCKPITIQNNGKKLELVNAQCLPSNKTDTVNNKNEK